MAMSLHPDIMRKFKTNPLGVTVAIILTFLLVYYMQSTVGPFASNSSIRTNMVNFWNNSNFILKIIWPMLGAFITLGFLVDEERLVRLKPLVLRIGLKTTGRLARTRGGQVIVNVGRAGQQRIERGRRVIRGAEEQLEEFEEGPV